MPHSKAYWTNVIDENPARIVDIFNTMFDTTESWLESPFGSENVTNLILAVRNTIVQGHPSTRRGRLIEAGMTDAVCRCVVKAYSGSWPWQMVSDEDKPSDFAPFLELLALIVDCIEQFPSPTKDLCLHSLERNWNELILRLENDPCNMMKPAEMYAGERATFLDVLMQILLIHPDFARTVDAPNDLTISFLMRCLMHSVAYQDYNKCILALIALIDPVYPHHELMFAYRLEHPRPLDIIARMQRGIPGRSFASFFTHYFHKICGNNIKECTDMLSALIQHASWTSPSDRDFLHDLANHTMAFELLFNILRLSGDELRGCEAEPDRAIVPILILMSYCAEKTNERDLMRTWTRLDVFGALESTLTQYGRDLTRVYSGVAVMFVKIIQIVQNTPSLLSITRPHFPRPRLLRTCLDMTFLHEDVLSRETQGKDPKLYKPLYWTWILVHHLEQLASIDRQCSRRGCRNRRVWRCRACKSVAYCGAECQSKDWPEHRLCCGFRGIRMEYDEDEDGPPLLPLPQRLPFRLEAVVPLSSLAAFESWRPDMHE